MPYRAEKHLRAYRLTVKKVFLSGPRSYPVRGAPVGVFSACRPFKVTRRSLTRAAFFIFRHMAGSTCTIVRSPLCSPYNHDICVVVWVFGPRHLCHTVHPFSRLGLGAPL